LPRACRPGATLVDVRASSAVRLHMETWKSGDPRRRTLSRASARPAACRGQLLEKGPLRLARATTCRKRRLWFGRCGPTAAGWPLHPLSSIGRSPCNCVSVSITHQSGYPRSLRTDATRNDEPRGPRKGSWLLIRAHPVVRPSYRRGARAQDVARQNARLGSRMASRRRSAKRLPESTESSETACGGSRPGLCRQSRSGRYTGSEVPSLHRVARSRKGGWCRLGSSTLRCVVRAVIVALTNWRQILWGRSAATTGQGGALIFAIASFLVFTQWPSASPHEGGRGHSPP